MHDWHTKAFEAAINHRKDINIWWAEYSRTLDHGVLTKKVKQVTILGVRGGGFSARRNSKDT